MIRRYVLLAVLAVLFTAPVGYLFLGSFTVSGRISFANYGSLAHRFDSAATGYLGQFYLTSALVSAVVVLGGLLVNSMAGYALARLRWRGREAVLLAVTSVIVLPFQAIAVPLYYLLGNLRDTYVVQFLPFIANAFSVCLFQTYFRDLPPEPEEAARIDGAGPWTLYARIAAPMARPAFAVVAALTFLSSWSSFLWPVMMIDQPTVRPLPVEIGVLQGQPPIDWGQVFAFGVLMVTPVLLVFLVFQRWFVRGATASLR